MRLSAWRESQKRERETERDRERLLFRSRRSGRTRGACRYLGLDTMARLAKLPGTLAIEGFKDKVGIAIVCACLCVRHVCVRVRACVRACVHACGGVTRH